MMKKSSYTEFGKEIKKALVDKGMTQRNLAKELKISEQYLSIFMRGKHNTERMKCRICESLGIKDAS